jgi:hypothetical protein
MMAGIRLVAGEVEQQAEPQGPARVDLDSRPEAAEVRSRETLRAIPGSDELDRFPIRQPHVADGPLAQRAGHAPHPQGDLGARSRLLCAPATRERSAMAAPRRADDAPRAVARLGLAGNPVQLLDRVGVADLLPATSRAEAPRAAI